MSATSEKKHNNPVYKKLAQLLDTIPNGFPARMCLDGQLQLGCSGSPPGGTYHWSATGPGNGTFWDPGTGEQADNIADPLFRADAPGQYSVEVEYTLSGLGTCPDTAGPIWVLEVDLDWDGIADDEEDPGQFVGVNNDDDDANGQIDMEQAITKFTGGCPGCAIWPPPRSGSARSPRCRTTPRSPGRPAG